MYDRSIVGIISPLCASVLISIYHSGIQYADYVIISCDTLFITGPFVTESPASNNLSGEESGVSKATIALSVVLALVCCCLIICAVICVLLWRRIKDHEKQVSQETIICRSTNVVIYSSQPEYI